MLGALPFIQMCTVVSHVTLYSWAEAISLPFVYMHVHVYVYIIHFLRQPFFALDNVVLAVSGA